MAIESPGYYNRDDPEKNFEEHRFIAGRALQSAELNEIQTAANYRIKQIGDSLFKDGDIVRDARAIINPATGITTLESGAIYLRGVVRGVPAASITVPITGTVVIGIYLIEDVVTSDMDSDLLDPARETRNYESPGADRLRVTPSWGYQGDGQSSSAEFFPIYYADDAQLRAKDPPPNLDAVTQAIARYDVDSNGSNYVVDGMRVTIMESTEAGAQVYNVQDGRARVNGFGITLNSSRRMVYAAKPDLRYIDSEPHVSATALAQRIALDRAPINEITQVRITAEKTETIIHGTFADSQDPLPDTSIVDIIEVKQGATIYVKGTDYKLTAGRVDWSLAGNEPAPGSSYTAKYQYITTVTPTAVDDTGFTITGAVVGSLVLTNYSAKLPRIDRLCIDESGAFTWIQGVATDYDPVRPPIPRNLLALCQVIQTWTSERSVVNDGVRMVRMSDLEGMSSRLDTLTDLVAQQKLVSDLTVREASAKKGLFVDPFTGDDMRDQGIVQTAAVAGGSLTLAIHGTPHAVVNDVTRTESCAYEHEVVLGNTARTGSMKVNPYMAFSPFPAAVTLTPAIDRWVDTETVWASPETRYFTTTVYAPWSFAVGIHGQTVKTGESQYNELVSSSTRDAEYLRQIQVSFRLEGFGANEALSSVTFDGIAVTPTA